MGYASYRVWKKGDGCYGIAREPLFLYIIQLVLNFAWPQIFFHFHLIGISAIELIILLMFAILTEISFFKVDHCAGYLIIPYIIWLSFASYLNFITWKLN